MNVLRYTILSTAFDLIYTPVWWYTGGAVYIVRWFARSVHSTWNMLGIGVWVKNIFTPMFQQYDWQGRIISFFMRLVQIIIRSVGLLVMVVLYGVICIAWFVIPIAVGYSAIQNVFNTYIPLV